MGKTFIVEFKIQPIIRVAFNVKWKKIQPNMCNIYRRNTKYNLLCVIIYRGIQNTTLLYG